MDVLFLQESRVHLTKNIKLHQLHFHSKSVWYATGFKKYLFEDHFIRQYIKSALLKWYLFKKVIGSIHILRTRGKVFVRISFFYPLHSKVTRHSFIKPLGSMRNNVTFASLKPLTKCKKHLFQVFVSIQLEYMLRVQVYIKYVNACISMRLSSKLSVFNQVVSSRLQFLLRTFKYRFTYTTWYSSILCVLSLFRFKHPDSILLSNFLASVLCRITKHIRFMCFFRKIIKLVRRIF